MKSTSQIMQTNAIDLSISYVNKILGMKFNIYEIQNLLLKAGMNSKLINKNRLNVFVPPYRTDILHEMDIAEDIAIAYGYENFIPEIPKIWTIGQEDKFRKFCNKLRNLMLGLNFQETMSLILTNRENLFKRMNIHIKVENVEDAEDVVETENAVSTEHNVVRNYLLPSLMSFLEINKTKGYPQRIFEISHCVEKTDDKNFQEVLKINGVIASTKTNFSEIKAVVEGILFSITDSSNVKILETERPFFINGRAAKILIKDADTGFFGEISPFVIENFGIDVPVTAFEINLNILDKLLNAQKIIE
ncbi:MAG: hypothetical protein QMD06_02055 [Candidatus Altarchaeum sp.]|nr:hypothetical protein [Candidatus Altarchaeum sp.]